MFIKEDEDDDEEHIQYVKRNKIWKLIWIIENGNFINVDGVIHHD